MRTHASFTMSLHVSWWSNAAHQENPDLYAGYDLILSLPSYFTPLIIAAVIYMYSFYVSYVCARPRYRWESSKLLHGRSKSWKLLKYFDSYAIYIVKIPRYLLYISAVCIHSIVSLRIRRHAKLSIGRVVIIRTLPDDYNSTPTSRDVCAYKLFAHLESSGMRRFLAAAARNPIMQVQQRVVLPCRA